MGGVAGHLAHVHEALTLSAQEIKDLLWGVATGKVDVYEKVDGQNLFFTWNEATHDLRSARNIGDIKRGGLDRKAHVARWTGHPAQAPFVEGFLAFEEAIHSTPSDSRRSIFGERGNHWVNAEIVCEKFPNVIRYNGNHIVMHGMMHADPGSSDLTDKFAALVRAVSGPRVYVRDQAWEVHGPTLLSLAAGSSIPKARLGRAYEALDKALVKYTEGDVTLPLREIVSHRLLADEVSRLGISSDRASRLIRRILHLAETRSAAGTESLRDLGRDLPKGTQREMSRLATVEGARKTVLRATYPIECAISDFSAVVLNGVQSRFVHHHQSEIDNLRECTARSIRVLQNYSGPGWKQHRELVEKQSKKLGDVNNITSTVEGVVFDHPHPGRGRLKLTGAFAPVNQIVGRALRLPHEWGISTAIAAG